MNIASVNRNNRSEKTKPRGQMGGNPYLQVEAVTSNSSLNPQQVKNKLLEIAITATDPKWVNILRRLAKSGIYRFYDFISLKLVEIASPNREFLSLVTELTTVPSGGLFANALTTIGEVNPQARVIFEAISAEKGLYPSLGYLFGGIAKKNPDESLPLLKEAMSSKDEEGRLFATLAIWVASEQLARKSDVLKLLKKGENDSSQKVRSQVLTDYFQILQKNPRTLDRIVRFLRKNKSLLTQALILCQAYRASAAQATRIISLVTDKSDVGSASQIAWLIPNLEMPTEKSLGIIKRLVRIGINPEGADLDHTVEAIAKKDESASVRFLEKWASHEKISSAVLRFYLPSLLYHALSGNKPRLLDIFRNWVNRRRRFRIMALDALKEMLSEVADNDPIVLQTLRLVIEQTINECKDPKRTLRGERRPRIQCLMLVDDLKSTQHALDYDAVATNIQQFPTVREFLGVNWISTMRKVGDDSHPLLRLLAKPFPDAEQMKEARVKIREKSLSLLERAGHEWSILFAQSAVSQLALLEKSLSRINPIEQGAPALRTSIRKSDGYDAAYSEVEVIALLRSKFTIEIHPTIGLAKRSGEHAPSVDLKASNHQTSFIEVITPGTPNELLHSSRAMSVKNRTGGILSDEVHKHLKELPSDWSYPFVVIIDSSHSEIDDFLIQNTLWGPLAVAFKTPQPGRITAKPRTVRLEPTIMKDPRIRLLSGVLLFKTGFNPEGDPYYSTDYVPNPWATYPLQRNLVGRLVSCFPDTPTKWRILFGTRISRSENERRSLSP